MSILLQQTTCLMLLPATPKGRSRNEPAACSRAVDCSFHVEPVSTSKGHHEFKGGCCSIAEPLTCF